MKHPFWREYFAFYQTRYFFGVRCPWFQLDIATGWQWELNGSQWIGVRLWWGHPRGWLRDEGTYHFYHCDRFLTRRQAACS